MKTARIFNAKDRTGRDIMVLACGQKGKGKMLEGIRFWPEFQTSVREAFSMLQVIARKNGIKTLFIEADCSEYADHHLYLDEDGIYMPV